MRRSTLLSFALACALGGTARAQVPMQLGYQGRLLKADGTPAQGVHQFTFALWPSSSGGTAPLWSDTFKIAVVDGLYSVQLGGDTDADGGANPLPSAIFDGTVLYLEITVDGETLSPRQSVGSVAYAIKSGNATNATNLSGGTIDATSVNVNGNPVVDNTGHLTGAAAADFLKTATTNAPLTGNGTLSSPISIPKCTSAVDGYLSAADWNTFNNKVSAADPRLSDARTPLPGSGDYIQNNATLAPQNASYNLSGKGALGGNMSVGGALSVASNAFLNGQVGIGTTSPAAWAGVDIQNTHGANINLGPNDSINEGGEIDWAGAGSFSTWATDVYQSNFRIFTGSMGPNQVDIFNAAGNAGLYVQGSLGVGTATPGTSLEVAGDSTFGVAGGGYHVVVNDIPTARWALGTGGYAFHIANDNPSAWTERFHIESNGNVGIGTANPLYKLDVQTPQNGGVRLKAPSAGAQHFIMDTDGTTNQLISLFRQSGGATDYLNIGKYFNAAVLDTDGLYSFNVSGVQQMVLTTSGNLGIGTTSPSVKFQVGNNGDGTVARANAWTTFSDARFKTDVATIDNASALVEQLRGVTFRWKQSGESSTGFIAQEVEKVLPDIVFTDSNGYKSVDYAKVTPVLVEALKAQQAEIDQAKAKIEEERAKNALLGARMDRIERMVRHLSAAKRGDEP